MLDSPVPKCQHWNNGMALEGLPRPDTFNLVERLSAVEVSPTANEDPSGVFATKMWTAELYAKPEAKVGKKARTKDNRSSNDKSVSSSVASNKTASGGVNSLSDPSSTSSKKSPSIGKRRPLSSGLMPFEPSSPKRPHIWSGLSGNPAHMSTAQLEESFEMQLKSAKKHHEDAMRCIDSDDFTLVKASSELAQEDHEKAAQFALLVLKRYREAEKALFPVSQRKTPKEVVRTTSALDEGQSDGVPAELTKPRHEVSGFTKGTNQIEEPCCTEEVPIPKLQQQPQAIYQTDGKDDKAEAENLPSA